MRSSLRSGWAQIAVPQAVYCTLTAYRACELQGSVDRTGSLIHSMLLATVPPWPHSVQCGVPQWANPIYRINLRGRFLPQRAIKLQMLAAASTIVQPACILTLQCWPGLAGFSGRMIGSQGVDRPTCRHSPSRETGECTRPTCCY